ncbi:MAG: riboflavin synthase, partial [Clostridia bacterium]|nr:riboflavin synthase [Clostridia bacterium]
SLNIGTKVNLERAMAASGRFGGHIVSGHIDGVGKISYIKKDDIAVWYTIKAEAKIMRYIIEKGSVALDGISLTVAKADRDSFLVSVIPHTAKQTIFAEKNIGSVVNIENDIIGKYIEKFTQSNEGITKDFLINNGF